MSGFSSLSQSARVGLILCPLLFILLISGYILVARSRHLFCFRPTQEQVRDNKTAEDYWARLSAANRQRVVREDLTELGGVPPDNAIDVPIHRETQETLHSPADNIPKGFTTGI